MAETTEQEAFEGTNGFARIQSASSVNTYRQCPRKYYYQYIIGLLTKPSIHLVRGKIAHSIVENFFKIDYGHISEENYDFELKIIMHEMISRQWEQSEEDLKVLGLSEYEIGQYLQETKEMLQFWLLDFLEKLKQMMSGPDEASFAESFRKLTPLTEEYFMSESLGLQGYIDAIHIDEVGRIKIIDYKTSKRDHITDEYKLQLAIYSILYYEKYRKYPEEAALFFFKHGERTLDIDQNLLEFARQEVEKVHLATKSKDIKDYPKFRSSLCKWSSGECDFYNQCLKDN